ncbi:translocase of chloroplast 159, chloroplastic-like [Nicotiana tabacum]|uniref:Translocase of chloroplast 159, chloroplastic-like n=2 Tax=Nicotiana TaxID=4085 RepID=A0A1S3YGA6_TOBAC|nr:PREDICTED: translocase of chloroplast 159, chloroplastic-like [Nicotiana sylvestris]XP_016451155.1 PREDICTED: translocase of chloroplast 159, chloroplastic-like [Nicotiana tabacum]
MDSKIYGVPLSTLQGTTPPAKVPLFTGIRAPLTVDDSDFEYSNGQKNTSSTSSYYGSDTGFESEGFVSGEDDFETASERLFASDPDEQNLEKTHFVNQFVVSRPFVKTPDEETGSSVGENDDSRSSLTDLYADSIEGLDSNDEYIDRPFVKDREIVDGLDSIDEYSDRPFVVDGENEVAIGTSLEGSDKDVCFAGSAVVDSAIPSIPTRGIRAHLSWDSEDEYLSTGLPEENDVLGAIRIPNDVVLERLDSAPKVRIPDVSDGEEGELELGNVIKSGMAEDLILTKAEDKADIDTVQNLITEGGDADGTFEGGEVVYQVASKESILLGQELDNDGKLLTEASQILDSNAEPKSADLFRDVEPSDTTYNSPREENTVSNFRADELNCGNSVVLLTGASGDSQNLESTEEEIYQGSDRQDIATETETESCHKLTENSEVDSLECTEISVPPTAEEQVYSSPSSSSDVTWSSTVEDDVPKLSDITQHTEDCLNPDYLENNGKDIDPVKLFKNEEVLLLGENDESLDDMKLIIDQLDLRIATADYDGEVSRGYLPKVDGEIVTDSDEEVDTDGESEGKEMFDAEALAALLMAAAGVGPEGRNVTIPSADGTRVFSLEQPSSSGSTFHSSRPAQPTNADSFSLSENKTEGISEEILSDEETKKLEKLQQLRVKYLRLIHKLNRSPEDSVAAQVLYQLVRAAGKSASQASSLDSAEKVAMELEAEDPDSLNFSLNILVIGKTGVGKSATINSIFGEAKSLVDAFVPATTNVKEIIGQLNGVTLNILDTPGLSSSLPEQSINRRTLLSIKKYMKKHSPDVVLYVDRIDTQSRDLGDVPLLKSISRYLGPSIWRNAIVTLTHAASSPPDGPAGYPVSYEMFVAQRSRIIQQLINHSIGDSHTTNAGLTSRPFSLVENHPLSPKNEKGEILLPNGENWRSQLLLLCYSMKILSEVDSVMKDFDFPDHRKLFGFPMRSLPLAYFLSSLLQSNVHPKASNNQGGDDMDSDIELAYSSDSDQEVEQEYDNLPPFRPLRKSQIAKLSKEQKRAYFDEYDYRVKLLQKKQWREELKRLRDMKKKGKAEIGDYMEEGADQETGSAAGVAIPLPDMALPNSFDGDNPAYKYRFLEPSSQLLARPVMDSQGWDHDCGYDGVSIEDHLAIAGQFPAVIALQLTKDKKEFNIHLDSSVSAKTWEKGSTMVGFDIQTLGKQLAYILKGETKVKNLKTNKTAAGVSITLLGDNLVTGLKLEDQFAIGKQLVVVGSTGTIRSQGNSAYGANLELRLREKDYPVGQDQSSLGLSLMKWRNDIIWGCNLQSQFSIGRNSKMAVRAGLNSKKSGQITVRTSTSDQQQISILGLLPIAIAIVRVLFLQTSEKNLI